VVIEAVIEAVIGPKLRAARGMAPGSGRGTAFRVMADAFGIC
jgi:hypothetical protein